MGWNYNYRGPYGELTPLSPTPNRSLWKRMHWILSCASVSSFYLISNDDWKTKKWRIFIEVLALREYYTERVEQPLTGGLFELAPGVGEFFKTAVSLWRIKDLDPHSCYYLGQYPYHWDYEWGCPVAPMGGDLYHQSDKKISDLIASQQEEPWSGPHQGPYEGPTGGTGVRPDILENLDEDEFIFYHGKRKYGNYLAQLQFQENLDTRLKKCIDQKYPPPGWKPKVRVREAGTEFDWPGEPIRSLDPPTPMGPRAKPPGVEQTTVNASMTLYFSPPDREDGLTIDLEIT